MSTYTVRFSITEVLYSLISEIVDGTVTKLGDTDIITALALLRPFTDDDDTEMLMSSVATGVGITE